MKPSEWIFMIVILAPLIPMALFGQWRLFFVFLSFYVCFGFQEWLSVKQTGMSISQHFWVFNDAHPIKANIIIGFMVAMWTGLILHFKKKKDK